MHIWAKFWFWFDVFSLFGPSPDGIHINNAQINEIYYNECTDINFWLVYSIFIDRSLICICKWCTICYIHGYQHLAEALPDISHPKWSNMKTQSILCSWHITLLTENGWLWSLQQIVTVSKTCFHVNWQYFDDIYFTDLPISSLFFDIETSDCDQNCYASNLPYWYDKTFNIPSNLHINYVMKAKSGKAPGVDGLIADILKNEASIHLLSELFTTCLKTSMIPTVWSLGLISTIPKCASNDPRVPLNYRSRCQVNCTQLPYRIEFQTSWRRTKNSLMNKMVSDQTGHAWITFSVSIISVKQEKP